MNFQWYDENLHGDWGGMTDQQIRLMRDQSVVDPELSDDERETLLAKADQALQAIENHGAIRER